MLINKMSCIISINSDTEILVKKLLRLVIILNVFIYEIDFILRKCRIKQERRTVKNASRVAVNREFKDLAKREIRRIPRGALSIFLTRFFVSFSSMEKGRKKMAH